MSVADRLAVQSFCYRGFKDIPTLIAKIRETGLAAVEPCKVHVDFADTSVFDQAVAQFHDAGVTVTSIGAVRFAEDEAAERKFFEFVRKAGADFITMDFAVDASPAAFRTAGKLADEYDVKLGIHNHGGRHWLGNSQILAHVFKNTSPRIGLCLDTAWAMHAGEDPIAMAEEFGDRLYAVHIKDFVFDRAGKHEDVVVGTGNLDLGKLNETLKNVGFAGKAILEYEGDVNNPVPALKQCVAAIREKMAD